MGILGTITGFLSGGDTLKQVGGIIDDLHMSGEEKAEAKQKLETILIQAEQAAQAAEQASQDRIEAAAVNEKIEITMDFTNDSDVQQSFALIVQIKDSNNTTISLSHVTGMLGAGQTLDQVLSYTPTEPGSYTVEKFLWDNFADPTALTDSKENFTLSVS